MPDTARKPAEGEDDPAQATAAPSAAPPSSDGGAVALCRSSSALSATYEENLVHVLDLDHARGKLKRSLEECAQGKNHSRVPPYGVTPPVLKTPYDELQKA